ncbi:MAG: alginate export family protein [Chthonomonadales bacterium]
MKIQAIVMATVALCVLAGTVSAQTPVTPPIQYFGSLRLRAEDWNWFPTDKANGAYNFVGGILRFGANRSTSKDDVFLELAAPILWNLPSHAIASAPQGQLGQGASYFASQHGKNFGIFAKQAYVRFKSPDKSGSNIRLGRFEFSDGAEVTPKDATLAYLQANRISQRLIGPFTFTHVGRSFDGGQVTLVSPKSTLTGLMAFPTKGVFTTSGMDTLTDIHLGYLSASFPRIGKEKSDIGRVFGVYYGDARQGAVKSDNRTLATRTTDKDPISLMTIGGNYVVTKNVGQNKLDALLWAAGQSGTWGAQRHGAFAYATEAGYQWRTAPMKPWVRAGYFMASGDGKSDNSTHGTFFPILPTPRIYARFPFYTEANIKDLFAQLILKPGSKTTVRADVHNLQLANSHDLWYGGGGAYDNSNFGTAGRPSGGRSDLAMLYDLSIDFQLTKATAITLYGAFARGGSVVRSIYKSPDSAYGYVEVLHKF